MHPLYRIETMNKTLFVILAITTSAVNADVFKCKSASGATEYKSAPCVSSAEEQGVLAIKPKNPQQEEQAQIRLKSWKDEQDANEKQKMDIAKAQQAELEKQQAQINKQIELDALTRSAAAAEAQALATQRLANKPLINGYTDVNPNSIQRQGEIEHQNRLNNNNSLYEPQHNYGQQNEQLLNNDNNTDDSHRRRHGHEGRHQRQHNEQVQHQ